MKAVFKKTALDRLYEIIEDAARNRKKIDYLLLTPQEFDEVRDACSFPWKLYHDASPCPDMSIRTVELQHKSRHWADARRFMVSTYKFHGFDIVVAPSEYH
jgi:hypothetical protein